MLENIAFWIGISAVAGVIITTWKSIDSARQERKLRFAEMMERTEDKFQKIFTDGKMAETGEDIDRLASDLLNLLDRLAFLEYHKKVDAEIVYFFRNYFRFGLTILEKMKKLDKDKIISEDAWPDLEKWVRDNNIKKFDDVMLPPKIRIFIQKIADAKKINLKD